MAKKLRFSLKTQHRGSLRLLMSALKPQNPKTPKPLKSINFNQFVIFLFKEINRINVSSQRTVQLQLLGVARTKAFGIYLSQSTQLPPHTIDLDLLKGTRLLKLEFCLTARHSHQSKWRSIRSGASTGLRIKAHSKLTSALDSSQTDQLHDFCESQEKCCDDDRGREKGDHLQLSFIRRGKNSS